MPPHCYVCGLTISDVPDAGRGRFTLVSFGPTDNAKMHDSRPMASQDRAGHPRNAVWLCTDHLALARQHQDIDTGAALRAIDTVIGRKPRPERGGDSAASPST